MTSLNEKDYRALKEELQSISVPKEALIQARATAFQQVRIEKQRRKRTFKMLATTAALILIFLTSIRVSPAFAQAVAKIPGFAPLVEMIAYDKGIEDILKNDYYEELHITETKNNLTFTLLGIIADESGMIINYELDAPYDIQRLDTKDINIKQNGKPLQASLSYSSFEAEPTTHIENTIEINTHEKIDYTNPNLELTIIFKDKHETAFHIPFTLQKEIAKSKYYPLNQTVEIDGQKILVKSLSISPLKAKLELALDSANTMQILQVKTMRLLDENGEEWGTVTNGITSFGAIRDGEASLLFQSNYFREPKSLRLEIQDVQALPKGNDYIEVDFHKKEVLHIPSSVNVDIKVSSDRTITAKYKTKEVNHFYQMFSQAVDANGEDVESNGSSYSLHEEFQESSYTFQTKGIANPVRIYFISYENYLKGSATVDIPLK